MAKYLITGVAGFIASKVRELLLAEDHEVIGVKYLTDTYWCSYEGLALSPASRQVQLHVSPTGYLF